MKWVIAILVVLLLVAVAVPFAILGTIAFRSGLPPVDTPLALLRWQLDGDDLVRIDEQHWLSVRRKAGARAVVEKLAEQRGFVVERPLGDGFILAPKACETPCAQSKERTAHIQPLIRGFDVLTLDL